MFRLKSFVWCLLLIGRAFDICAQSESNKIRPLLVRRGFVNLTEVGVLLGSVADPYRLGQTLNRTSFTANSFNGYRFSRGLAVGATLGLDWYARNALLPISLGVRGELSSRRVSPFYAVDIGWGFPWLIPPRGLTYEGGWHLSPALGLRIATGTGTPITWSIGYKHQRVASSQTYNDGRRERNEFLYNRLSIRVGIGF